MLRVLRIKEYTGATPASILAVCPVPSVTTFDAQVPRQIELPSYSYLFIRLHEESWLSAIGTICPASGWWVPASPLCHAYSPIRFRSPLPATFSNKVVKRRELAPCHLAATPSQTTATMVAQGQDTPVAPSHVRCKTPINNKKQEYRVSYLAEGVSAQISV